MTFDRLLFILDISFITKFCLIIKHNWLILLITHGNACIIYNCYQFTFVTFVNCAVFLSSLVLVSGIGTTLLKGKKKRN